MKALILILTLSISFNSFGQKEDIKYAAFNVISGGIVGGFGSAIHKKYNETFGKAFFNGFKRGSIGGFLNSISKQLLVIQARQNNLDWKLCWSSKLINSISNTILYNATINESKILNNLTISVGFLRLNTNNKVQIDAISFGCFMYAFTTGGKLDINKTLITGMPIFNYDLGLDVDYLNIKAKKDSKRFVEYSKEVQDKLNSMPDVIELIDARHLGLTLGQNVLLQKGFYSNKVLLHELTHTYQRLQHTSINNLSKTYIKYSNFKFLHNDLSAFDILYFIQNKTLGYANNFFEKEANYFGSFK